MQACVLPAITSTNGKWRRMIEEANALGLRRIAFFPTCMTPDERFEAYNLLEKSCIQEIPFVHLRHDITVEEIRYFKKKFGTKKFNLHSPLDVTFLPENNLSEFKKEIYIENSTFPWMNSVKNWAGICLDVTHFEAEMLNNSEVVHDWSEGLKKYKVGAWHVGAIFNPAIYDNISLEYRYDLHRFDSLKRFEYVRKYVQYLPDTIVLELENSLDEQLVAKKYVEEMIREELSTG